MPKPNLAARLERILTLRILRGVYAPDSTLPSIRALALEFETTIPTIQRVVARLEAHRLLTSRPGSGMTVSAPERASLSIAPLWLEAYREQPERAAGILADFLELRRVIAAHLLTQHRHKLLAEPTLLQAALAAGQATEPGDRMEADLAFTQLFLRLCGQVASQAVFNTVEQILREVPAVADAFYGEAAQHQQLIGQLVLALASPDPTIGFERAMAAWDAGAVERFRQGLLRSLLGA